MHTSPPKNILKNPFSGSLGTVRIWHSSTYRLESTLNYGMERVWCVCGLRGSNNVALGYDEGSIIIKVFNRHVNDHIFVHKSQNSRKTLFFPH